MSTKQTEINCLSCGRSENVTPLIHLLYKKKDNWICSQCLPILIHSPQKLSGKIEDADNIKPAPHH